MNPYSLANSNTLSNREWDGYCLLGFHTGSTGYCDNPNFAQKKYDQWVPAYGDYYKQNDPDHQLRQLQSQPQISDAEFNQALSDATQYDPNFVGPQQSIYSCSGAQAAANRLSDQSNYLETSYETIRWSEIYVPTWMDYATSGEKLINDRLESEIAFAAICQTDTTFPYGCNSHHSQIAQNYDLTVSPNVNGLKDYIARNTRTVWYEQTIQTTSVNIAAIQRDSDYVDEYNFRTESYTNAVDVLQNAIELDNAIAYQQNRSNNHAALQTKVTLTGCLAEIFSQTPLCDAAEISTGKSAIDNSSDLAAWEKGLNYISVVPIIGIGGDIVKGVNRINKAGDAIDAANTTRKVIPTLRECIDACKIIHNSITGNQLATAGANTSNAKIVAKTIDTGSQSNKAIDGIRASVGKSPNQLNKAISTGKAPKQVKRVDQTHINAAGKIDDYLQVHFKNCSNCALRKDGVWKHKPPAGFKLDNKTKKWLTQNGWVIPEGY